MNNPQPLGPSLNTLLDELTKHENPRNNSGGEVISCAKKKILAVDDIQEVLNSLSRILGTDYDIRVARKVDSAILLMQNYHFDLFILDYGMPEISGIEFLSLIRNFPEYQKTPVMFLSANTEERIVKRAVALGVKDYITKPINPEFLKIRIKDILTQAYGN
ncbi:MAG: hypothetical protein Ta2B_20270 [Termitinemataceae bacterium]|nr:MAG: hypothetical protein Ta2B_20270 [Termitinemataceae bacterium]